MNATFESRCGCNNCRSLNNPCRNRVANCVLKITLVEQFIEKDKIVKFVLMLSRLGMMIKTHANGFNVVMAEQGGK